jgi:head-tail adaptor
MSALVAVTRRDLRQRVEFQRAVQVRDSLGGSAASWSSMGARWGLLTPYRAQKRGGAETVIAARLQGMAIFDLWVVFDSVTSTITPDDRVRDLDSPGVWLNIRFAQDMDGLGRYMLMQAELGGAA